MFRQCKKCRNIKMWFNFWLRHYYCANKRTELCKACAKEIATQAIEAYDNGRSY